MGVQNRYGVKKINNISLLLVSILTAFMLVYCVIDLFKLISNAGPAIFIANEIVIIIGDALLFVYAFYLYKKPHGNLLRYLMIIFAIELMYLGFVSTINSGANFYNISLLVSSGMVAYMSGRLHKYVENNILFSISIVLLLIGFISIQANESIIQVGAPLINMIIMFAAYTARYYDHKEAGQVKDQENK